MKIYGMVSSILSIVGEYRISAHNLVFVIEVLKHSEHSILVVPHQLSPSQPQLELVLPLPSAPSAFNPLFEPFATFAFTPHALPAKCAQNGRRVRALPKFSKLFLPPAPQKLTPKQATAY